MVGDERVGAKQSQCPPGASPKKAEGGQSSPVRERESYGRVGGRGWVGEEGPCPRGAGVSSLPPCTPEASMEESSFCSPSLSGCRGGSRCLAGSGVLQKSPTGAGFERGLDYFRTSQKTGGYVRSNLSKCNQISALS